MRIDVSASWLLLVHRQSDIDFSRPLRRANTRRYIVIYTSARVGWTLIDRKRRTIRFSSFVVVLFVLPAIMRKCRGLFLPVFHRNATNIYRTQKKKKTKKPNEHKYLVWSRRPLPSVARVLRPSVHVRNVFRLQRVVTFTDKQFGYYEDRRTGIEGCDLTVAPGPSPAPGWSGPRTVLRPVRLFPRFFSLSSLL